MMPLKFQHCITLTQNSKFPKFEAMCIVFLVNLVRGMSAGFSIFLWFVTMETDNYFLHSSP